MKYQEKNKMKKSIIAVVATIFLSTVSTLFLSKDIYATSVSEVRRAALAKAAIDGGCFNYITLKETIDIGTPLTSIYTLNNDKEVEVGQWITKTTDTTMKCSQVLSELFSGVTAQRPTSSSDSTNILSNVYMQANDVKTLNCKYKIKKDQSYSAEYYSFASGWYYYNDDFSTVHWEDNPVQLKYNVTKEQWVPVSDSRNSYWVNNLINLRDDRKIKLDVSNPTVTCQQIINPESNLFSLEIGFEDDAGHWRELLVNASADHTVGYVDSSTVIGELSDDTGSNSLELMTSGLNNFIVNIDHKYNKNGLLESDAAKYLMLGRVFFNGDGGYPATIGCNGKSALNTPDNVAALTDPEGRYKWQIDVDASIAKTRGWIGGVATSLITKMDGVTLPSDRKITVINGLTVSCDDIVSFLGSVHINVSENKDIVDAVEGYINVFDPVKGESESTPPVGDTVATGDVDEQACYQHAKSLGWIICPIIYGMRDVVTDIYEHVEPMIAVNTNVIDDISNESGGVYTAWVQFRNFANIAFVIFFVVVIFSQITGLGIDNYGIKKLLPKLIIAALLINLSYFIVTIMIDLSNIVGNGIQGFFNNISIVGSGGTGSGGTSFKAITALLVGGIAVGAGAYFAFGGWTLIIPILLYLLSAAISLFFAWIVLGLRQAIIIILVVLSPLAVVMMALPNMSKYFKKYTDLLKGVLVVYPIIGALIGAGSFASSLLMYGTEHNFTMTLVAGLLCVIPYLLIPSLTSRSLEALGNIGQRMSSLGQRLGNSASHGIGNLEEVRNLRQDSAEGASARKGRLWMATHRRAAERVRNGSASRRQANQYKRNSALANSRETDRINARGAQVQYERLSSQDGFDAAMASISNKERETSIADQDTLFSDRGIYDDDSKFATEVYNAIKNDDDIKLEALMRKAAKGSDNQRGALISSMDRALGEGSVSERIARAYGSHVTTNDPYKAKDRSAFEQGAALLNSINGGSYSNGEGANFTRSHYTARGFAKGKVTADQIFKMDDNELNAIRDSLGSMNDDDKNAVISAMMNARTIKEGDKNNKYDYVQDSTIKLIDQIIGNNTINIPHNNNPTPPAPNILPFPGNPNP